MIRIHKHRIGVSGIAALALVVVVTSAVVVGQSKRVRLVRGAPESAGMSAPRLRSIDAAVKAAIERKELPGAVVLVGRKGRVVYRKAFGSRVIEPNREPMTIDTVFDMASITKVAATATAVMILVERGLVRLNDPVARYIPEFSQSGKDRVTVEQLLTHRAGFVPDNPIEDYAGTPQESMDRIYRLAPEYEPGTRFVYSDVGYIVAAEVIRRVSGKTVDQFAAENVFRPLGMRSTGYSSAFGVRGLPMRGGSRFAPTEQRDGRWMRGEVHDPRAYALGGVAGHAGLFSTADDMAVFCQMILNGGTYRGVRVLSPYGVERMTRPRGVPPGEFRGIGWDVATSFSANRGDLFPLGTFGHTGFTGTSLWIDPASETFVVFLSNRVHPAGKGDVARVRSLVASIVAASIVSPPYAPQFESVADSSYYEAARSQQAAPRTPQPGGVSPVLAGIDVLVRDGFKQLEGRRIGLITNHTGRDRSGKSTIDLLAGAKKLKLVVLFSPEHGLRGLEDTAVGNTTDEKTGLPVFSLYSQNQRRPTDEMLKGIDTLVFDIQDIGTRFYTYITTCGYVMEEAAKRNLKFVVLDRPNPLNGVDVEGPIADEELTVQYSFTSYHPLPVRYGMTIGELAMLFNRERKINADVEVIRIEGWRRAEYFDGTGMTWINPSPNMRSLAEAVLYPGIGLLETTNLSVGRGTDTPFEVIGAPWLDGVRLAEALNRAALPGVRFVPIRFTPKSSKFANEECGGVNVVVTDRAVFRSVSTGIEVAFQLNRLFGSLWRIDDYLRLLVNRATLAALKEGRTAAEIVAGWQAELVRFNRIRLKYLIY